ncbi:uncharacterized protein LOC142644841 isoform X2 [Dermatophagoides pteronyssinus]|uniref:uncharacterized protein LOC142644841 isoform X2 n=1 Tax=Dermatophagoides pteronyssinus TaxID=6956 RepID=UPI003F66F3CF
MSFCIIISFTTMVAVMMMATILLLFNFHSNIIIVADANPLKENSRAIHHPNHSSKITSLNWSLPLISMLNGHFQTASTIFPCLDTFDVRLFWKVHHSSFIEHHHHHHHRYTQSFDPIVKLSTTNNNDNLNIRHLIRLYWTDKDVVDKVLLSAAVKHQQLKQQQLHRQSKWPSLSHFLKKKRKIIKNNNKKIHYWTNVTNPYRHNNQRQQGNHHYQFFYYSTRPSTLIEMKKFHYVREYSLDMIRMDNNNHDDNHTGAIHNHHNDDGQTANSATIGGGGGGQIKIDCNTFQPNEDIYYCLVYLILYKNAVLYENIPHCIPTIDKQQQQQQQQQPNGNFVHLDSFTKSSSVFRDIVGQHRAVSSSSSYPSEIKFNYNSNNNNDESVMNSSSRSNAQIKLKTFNENYNSSSYNNEYESFIQKNVDDDENENYSQRMSTSINHNAFSDVKILVNNSSLNNRNPSNIRFVQQQPKQNTVQQRKSLNQIDTIIVRTHACSCKLNSNKIFNDDRDHVNQVNQKKFETNIETLNIGDNEETIIINLIIKTCSKHADDEEFFSESKSALLLDDDYLFNHMNVGDVNSDVVDDDDEEKNLKKLNSNKMKMKKKRKKNKRIDQANNNEEESDNEKKQKQIPMHNKLDANNNNRSLNEFDSYNRMDDYYYHPTTAAVCIISIDKPEKYLFKLLNIEPSMDWLVENPRLATYFTETIFNDNNDNNNSSNLDVSSIDYSHFLVVRNGRLSIDPQINIIENHSQIHYLQSNYLRLEALSSMNLTIKFQKRSYYRRKQRDNHYNNHDNNHDDDYYNDNDDGGSGRHSDKHFSNNDNSFDHSLFSKIFHRFYSWIKQTVSLIAIKTFRLSTNNEQTIAPPPPNYSKTITNAYKASNIENIIIEQQQQNNELSMINMPTFHIVSIILSIFIVLTFLIYVIIAFYSNDNNGNHNMNNDCSHEIITTGTTFAHNRTGFKQQQSFSNNNNDTDKTKTICNQQRKNNRNNANNNNNDNNVIGIDSIITNSNDEMNKSIDSFSSIQEYHIRQTICDNRQESSSSNRQLDYYDIYEPLTMKIIDATKSITNTFEKSNNHIPFVNERQIVNSDDQDDGSTIQHSSLLQKQPRSPSKLPLLTTSNTLTFGNHNNHSSSFVHSQNLPINQLIIIEQETKQQQQTLPSIKHNNHHHHHFIKPVLLKTFMSDQNHYE